MRPHPGENKCIAVAILLPLAGSVIYHTLSRAVASFLFPVVFLVL
jgi:hypothetical protein